MNGQGSEAWGSGKSSIRSINQNYSIVRVMGNDIIDRSQAEEELQKALRARKSQQCPIRAGNFDDIRYHLAL